MANPSICSQVIKARQWRVSKVDACGGPVTGAGAATYSFNGFIKVEAAPVFEAGTDFVEKNAFGELCINSKDPDTFRRYDLKGEICTLDPDMYAFMTNSLPATTPGIADEWSGAYTGYIVSEGQGSPSNRFTFDLWTLVPGDCNAQGLPLWLRHKFFNCGNGKVGPMIFENGKFIWQFEGLETSHLPGSLFHYQCFLSRAIGVGGCGNNP